MTRAPHANEMVAPKRGTAPLGGGAWKVTARYIVRLEVGELRCVRVRAPGGFVQHYSLPVFNRLFGPVAKRVGRGK